MVTNMLCRDSIEKALDEDAPGLLQVIIYYCNIIIYEYNKTLGNLSSCDPLWCIFFLSCRFF
jgi:hypothetical protein